MDFLQGSWDQMRLYEDREFNHHGTKDKRYLVINLGQYAMGEIHSLHEEGFKDCLSSIEYRFSKGRVVTLYEEHDGDIEGGKRYKELEGEGRIEDLRNHGFENCASAWKWTKRSGEIFDI